MAGAIHFAEYFLHRVCKEITVNLSFTFSIDIVLTGVIFFYRLYTKNIMVARPGLELGTHEQFHCFASSYNSAALSAMYLFTFW